LSGKANVIVCDGFVGNVLLKFYESIGGHALGLDTEEAEKYPFAFFAKLLFNRLFQATRISRETEREGAVSCGESTGSSG
jgi:fatty acid/phospholipid biosynthesis enzyme